MTSVSYGLLRKHVTDRRQVGGRTDEPGSYTMSCVEALSALWAAFFMTVVPLDISAFSVRPPHRESVTSGRSLAESDRHSVPLSAAALPTDWGDWEPERISESIQCLVAASASLGGTKRGRHVMKVELRGAKIGFETGQI